MVKFSSEPWPAGRNLIFWARFARLTAMRKNNQLTHERPGPHSGRLRSTLTVACVLMLAVAVVVVVASQDPPVTPPPVQTVDVLAERFSFTPSEIKTTVGTTLQIRLESDDTSHGFRIIGTDVNIEIPKRGRGTTTVTFNAEKPGRYKIGRAHV